jgi:hypothetical protein
MKQWYKSKSKTPDHSRFAFAVFLPKRNAKGKMIKK